jgi:Family of unknown function (DUF5755)
MTRKIAKLLSPPPLPVKRGGTAAAAAAIAGGVTQGLVNQMLYGMGFIVITLLAVLYYITYLYLKKPANDNNSNSPPGNIGINPLTGLPSMYLSSVSTRNDPFSDPYSPPLKNDGIYFPPDSNDIRGLPIIASPSNPATCNSSNCIGGMSRGATAAGIPINVQTRGYNQDFVQIGLLTRERKDRQKDTSNTDNMILPLFGRRIMNGRDKYQYYTMSNTGAVNTKLPVKVRGRNCINEYGCDELNNGDLVTVEGYNETFRATVYENSAFSYIPYL